MLAQKCMSALAAVSPLAAMSFEMAMTFAATSR